MLSGHKNKRSDIHSYGVNICIYVIDIPTFLISLIIYKKMMKLTIYICSNSSTSFPLISVSINNFIFLSTVCQKPLNTQTCRPPKPVPSNDHLHYSVPLSRHSIARQLGSVTIMFRFHKNPVPRLQIIVWAQSELSAGSGMRQVKSQVDRRRNEWLNICSQVAALVWSWEDKNNRSGVRGLRMKSFEFLNIGIKVKIRFGMTYVLLHFEKVGLVWMSVLLRSLWAFLHFSYVLCSVTVHCAYAFERGHITI